MPDDPFITVCRGLPGAGKTYWTRRYVAAHPLRVRINRDDLRMMGYGSKVDLPVHAEDYVSHVERTLIRDALALGKFPVVDAMNLNPTAVRDLYELGFVRFRDFPMSIESLVLVNASRPEQDSIREASLRQLHMRYTQPDGSLIPPPNNQGMPPRYLEEP